MKFKFCPLCGQPLKTKIINDHKRLYCVNCEKIHYRNPTAGVAVIVMQKNRLLLIKRLGSYEGMWCIPCGHVEWNEDIRISAKRELAEETGLILNIGPVFTAHSNFHDMEKQTVGIWFWGECAGGELKAGSDASDAQFFPIDNLPEPMAFPTDLLVCRQLKDYMKSHQFKFKPDFSCKGKIDR